jgi:hypothetical protein
MHPVVGFRTSGRHESGGGGTAAGAMGFFPGGGEAGFSAVVSFGATGVAA